LRQKLNEMIVDFLIENASQLVTPLTHAPGFGELKIIENGAVGCYQGKILAVGNSQEVRRDITLSPEATVLDATNQVITPGFVDPHTHPIFWGTRENEFVLRIQGKTYQEIAKAGGGIRSSVRNLRKASEQHLIESALPHLDNFLKNGTTTIEAKSGYGLSLEDELKSLRVIKELNRLHPIDLIPTFLGAHEIPDEYRTHREDYIKLIIEQMIPQVAQEGLAEFCDIFCENHVFNPNETKKILLAAKEAGFKIKIHADQLTASGGSEIAAELGAVSADHLDYITSDAMEQLKKHGVIPVLLPGAVFFLGLKSYAPARKMINMGLPVAIATDFNPGSCMTESMPILMTISCINMKILPREAWIAATINAARAINREQSLGSLENGKQADIVIWNIPNVDYLPYHFGVNLVDKVFKNGKIVHQLN